MQPVINNSSNKYMKKKHFCREQGVDKEKEKVV
jgi:hypothetical protein